MDPKKIARRAWARAGRRVIGATLVMALAGSLSSAARAADLIPFEIGISALSASILPVYLAEAGGFYEKQGLKVDVVNSEGGTRGLQVLLSGEMQAMHVGLAPVVQANAQGADLRLVASTTNIKPNTLFASKKTTPPLPKGSTVGISTFGSESDIAVSMALQQLGMTRDDVTISQIGGSAQLLAAMIAGRIDAAPLLEPTITAAKERGLVPLVDLAAQQIPWVFDGVVVTRSYLKEHPDIILRFLKAYLEGAVKAVGDEKFAKDAIAKRYKTTDAAVIDATYNEFKRQMPLDAAPSVEGARNVLAQLKAIDVPVASENVDDYLDLSLVERLHKDGFVDELWKRYGLK